MGNPNLDICHLICFIYNLSHIWEIPDTSCRLRVITVLLYFCSLQECHYYNLEVKFIQGNSCSRVFGDSAEFYCTAQVLLFYCISEKCRWEKQREVLPDMLSNNGNPSVLLQVASVQKFALSENVIFTYKIEHLQQCNTFRLKLCSKWKNISKRHVFHLWHLPTHTWHL